MSSSFTQNQYRWAICAVMIDRDNKPMKQDDLIDEAIKLLLRCSPEELLEAEIKGSKIRNL